MNIPGVYHCQCNTIFSDNYLVLHNVRIHNVNFNNFNLSHTCNRCEYQENEKKEVELEIQQDL